MVGLWGYLYRLGPGYNMGLTYRKLIQQRRKSFDWPDVLTEPD